MIDKKAITEEVIGEMFRKHYAEIWNEITKDKEWQLWTSKFVFFKSAFKNWYEIIRRLTEEKAISLALDRAEQHHGKEMAMMIDKEQNDFKEIRQTTIREIIDEIERDIEEFKNPYPKDIFIWANPENAEITRGQFNKFAYERIELMKEEFLKILQQLKQKFGVESETV